MRNLNTEFETLQVGNLVYSLKTGYSVIVKKLDLDEKVINEAPMEEFFAIPIKQLVMQKNDFAERRYPDVWTVEWKKVFEHGGRSVDFIIYSSGNGEKQTNFLYKDPSFKTGRMEYLHELHNYFRELYSDRGFSWPDPTSKISKQDFLEIMKHVPYFKQVGVNASL